MTAVQGLTAARPPGLPDEEAMFLDVVREFAQAEVEPRARTVEEEGRIPGDLLALVDEQELHAIAAPGSLGGAGGRPVLALLAVERLAEASAATACLVGDRQAAMAALAGLVGETPVGAAPALADGARFTPRADGAALEGHASQVLSPRPDAGFAVLGVAGDGTAAAALVPPGRASLGAVHERTGLRGLATVTVGFDGIDVSAGAVGGSAAASAGRVHRLLAVGAVALGVGRRAVDEAATYLQERSQFGRTLAEFGALTRMLADAAGAVAGAAALLHDTAARSDVPHAAALLAARAATSAAVRAADDAVQLHGGYGYVQDHVAERLLRDAVSLRALAGGRRHGPAADPLLGTDATEPT